MSSETITEDHVPVWVRHTDGVTITQWDYPSCESLGLLKMDFLGLRNLTIMDDAVKMVKQFLELGHGSMPRCGGSRGQGRDQIHTPRHAAHVGQLPSVTGLVGVRPGRARGPIPANATPKIEFGPLTLARSGRLEGRPRSKPPGKRVSRVDRCIVLVDAGYLLGPRPASSPESPRGPGSPWTITPSSKG
ncbi:hypothetical protein SGLAM104S_07447 [Streptomyces glaucescens]